MVGFLFAAKLGDAEQYNMIHYQYKTSELLFIGINPHPGSFDRGVPFSNNKLFWYLLLRAGLIEETMDDLRNDDQLRRIYTDKFNKGYKLGLINIIERPTRDITMLKKGEEEQGRMKIQKIIKSQKPKVVCFVGKVTYEKYMGSKDFTFGWQNDLFHSKTFVMHFPLRGKAEVRIDELKEITQMIADSNQQILQCGWRMETDSKGKKEDKRHHVGRKKILFVQRLESLKHRIILWPAR